MSDTLHEERSGDPKFIPGQDPTPVPPDQQKVVSGAENIVDPFLGPDEFSYEGVQGHRPPKSDKEPKIVETIETSGLHSLRDLMADVFGPETVCGKDTRVQIKTTTTWPWRAVCSLLITDEDGNSYPGSGWMIGPNAVMTAGHAVYNKRFSGSGTNKYWAHTIKVIPGRNGATAPYGTSEAQRTNLRSVKGWIEDQNPEADYGCIIIPDALGQKTGWFGYGYYPTDYLEKQVMNISGYPEDKPDGTQWYEGGALESVEDRKLNYLIDTAGGESGSPVWLLKASGPESGRYGVGIHAYGGCPNSATRITKTVFDNMKKWANESTDF